MRASNRTFEALDEANASRRFGSIRRRGPGPSFSWRKCVSAACGWRYAAAPRISDSAGPTEQSSRACGPQNLHALLAGAQECRTTEVRWNICQEGTVRIEDSLRGSRQHEILPPLLNSSARRCRASVYNPTKKRRMRLQDPDDAFLPMIGLKAPHLAMCVARDDYAVVRYCGQSTRSSPPPALAEESKRRERISYTHSRRCFQLWASGAA